MSDKDRAQRMAEKAVFAVMAEFVSVFADIRRETRQACALFLEREADKHVSAANEIGDDCKRWDEREIHRHDAEILRRYAEQLRKESGNDTHTRQTGDGA